MKDCKRIRMFLFTAFTLLVPLAGAAPADSVGSFTRVEGNVDILRAAGRAAAPVRTGDAVSMGDAIRTKRNAKAEIQFRDETVIQLAPESRIKIDEYSFRANDSRGRGILSLFRGKIRAIVSKMKGVVPVGSSESEFNINSPTAIAGVRGTDFVVYYERGITGVIFREGMGFARNRAHHGRGVVIHAGEAAFITGPNAPPTKPMPVSAGFIAHHLRDTTAVSAGSEGGGGGDASPGPAVSVSEANTTYEALTDMVADGGSLGASQPVVNPTSIVVPGSPPPPPPPITVSHPELLPTRVKVTVPLP